jgi:hypothetical protein
MREKFTSEVKIVNLYIEVFSHIVQRNLLDREKLLFYKQKTTQIEWFFVTTYLSIYFLTTSTIALYPGSFKSRM